MYGADGGGNQWAVRADLAGQKAGILFCYVRFGDGYRVVHFLEKFRLQKHMMPHLRGTLPTEENL